MSLGGKVVAVTRPAKQADELAEIISRLGGKPYMVPTLEVKPQSDKIMMKHLLGMVLNGRMDFLVFLSVNGVRRLIEYLGEAGLKDVFLDALDKTMIVAVGPKTRMELEKHGVEVDLTPRRYCSEGIVESLSGMNLKEKTIVIPCSNRSTEYLRRKLGEMGAKVLEIPVYECTLPADRSKVYVFIDDLVTGKIDVVTFTSSSAVMNLFKIAGGYVSVDNLINRLRKTVVVAIGPVTQRALEKLGVEVNVVPTNYTLEDMMNSLLQHLDQNT